MVLKRWPRCGCENWYCEKVSALSTSGNFTAKMRQIRQSICYSQIKVKMIRATHYWKVTRIQGCCSSAIMHIDLGRFIWGLIKGRRVSWVNFRDTSLYKPWYVLSLLGQTEGVIRRLGPIGPSMNSRMYHCKYFKIPSLRWRKHPKMQNTVISSLLAAPTCKNMSVRLLSSQPLLIYSWRNLFNITARCFWPSRLL